MIICDICGKSGDSKSVRSVLVALRPGSLIDDYDDEEDGMPDSIEEHEFNVCVSGCQECLQGLLRDFAASLREKKTQP